MLKTARTLGRIPGGRALGEIDWIPIDLLASIIWDLSSGSQESVKDSEDGDEPLQIFHLVNPKRRHWNELLHVIKDKIGMTMPLQEVSMADWVWELRTRTWMTGMLYLRDRQLKSWSSSRILGRREALLWTWGYPSLQIVQRNGVGWYVVFLR